MKQGDVGAEYSVLLSLWVVQRRLGVYREWWYLWDRVSVLLRGEGIGLVRSGGAELGGFN